MACSKTCGSVLESVRVDAGKKVKTNHHQNPRHPPRPLPLKALVHAPHPLTNFALVLVDLLELRPVIGGLRDLRVPVTDFGRLVDVRVDTALEDLGKVSGFGEGLVEEADRRLEGKEGKSE